MRCLVLILLFAALAGARAEMLQGTVTGIADGDTLYVTDARHRTYKIRLLGIDAPEHGQAWGHASKQALAKRVYRQPVEVEWQKRDAYGRLLGKVMLSGRRDANLAQLASGMAWWNRKYAFEQRDDDAIRYREAEHAAKKQRLGLWSQKNPVPPWRWRYANPRQGARVKP